MDKYIVEKQNEDLGIVLPNLGEYPIKRSIGWTTSIPDNYFIPMVKIHPKPRTPYKMGMPWRLLSQTAQWNFFKMYYFPDLLKYCGVGRCVFFPELNKKKRIHAHGVIYSEDPEWDAMEFIQFCTHHENCVKIHGGKNMDKLNKIHTIKDKDEVGKPYQWVEYVRKDHGKLPLRPFDYYPFRV